MSLTLVDAIANDEKTLSQLSKNELIELRKTSIANGDFRALRIAINQFTGLYDHDDHNPYWLVSDFSAPLWQLEINCGKEKKPIEITFDWQSVVLEDGKRLTDPCNAPLLLAFKYWITAADNPRYNGGKLIKGTTVYEKVKNIKTMINALLLHSAHLKLSEQHLAGLTNEFLLDIFVRITIEGNIHNGLYHYTERVTELLRQHLPCISDDDAQHFANIHPYLTRHLIDDEKCLGLSVNERIKACCWLYRIGFYSYQRKGGSQVKKFVAKGNQAVLAPYLYDDNILPSQMNFPIFEELRLKDEINTTEYRAMPNKDVSKGLGENRLTQLLQCLVLLPSLRDKGNVSHCPSDALEDINLKRIKQHAKVKTNGRFKTLPVKLVFDLIEQTYTFANVYQDAILKSTLTILIKAQAKNTGSHSNLDYISKGRKGYNSDISTTERQAWLQTDVHALIAPKLAALGVKGVSFINRPDDVFALRRNIPTLLDLYDVLIGSIQALTGIIMAKRQDELVSLKPHGNLAPNINPASKNGQESEYWLIARVKKSGKGGESEENVILKRPIPHSFALLIWKLELFNQAITKAKCNKNNLALFNPIDNQKMTISGCKKDTYNKHLDVICDYFETPLVDFGENDIRRYYVRQHQLRRFFAMVFFYSKGFDGLDSLSWMLGHTDIEHLHHYITENESGAVLNGVKASYLRDSMESNKIVNIDRLQALIAKRYGVNAQDISLASIKNTVEDYDDEEDYQTQPKIETLRAQEQLESHILSLLNDKSITLEPEFFTLNQGDRKINDFRLTLQINELD